MACVLLVEPDASLARIYAKALQYAGHTVAWAADAQTAIDQADAYTPDIVVLELQMPAHNGIEFLYEFRSYPEWQDIPIIINSYIPPQDLRAVQKVLRSELGVRAVQFKPQTSLTLLIRSIADNARSANV